MLGIGASCLLLLRLVWSQGLGCRQESAMRPVGTEVACDVSTVWTRAALASHSRLSVGAVGSCLKQCFDRRIEAFP